MRNIHAEQELSIRCLELALQLEHKGGPNAAAQLVQQATIIRDFVQGKGAGVHPAPPET